LRYLRTSNIYSRPVVHNSRPVVHNSRPVVHNSRPVVHNSRLVVHNSRPVVHNSRPVVHNCRPMYIDLITHLRNINKLDTVTTWYNYFVTKYKCRSNLFKNNLVLL